jgi:hypothetical protein
MKLQRSTPIICALAFYSYPLWANLEVDALLERTTYAELLNELICLTDSVALLEHPKTEYYDKRFIEDSILGKLVRAHAYLNILKNKEVTAHEIAYAQSWIDLAQRSTSQPFLLQEFARFAERLHEYHANVM